MTGTAKSLCDFIDASPTSYHAADNKGVEYKAHQHLPVLVEAADRAAPADEASWVKARIAADLGLDPAGIVGMDLSFYDSQKATAFGREGESANSGGGGELINAPRLDDLAGCQAILEAFCSVKPGLVTQR